MNFDVFRLQEFRNSDFTITTEAIGNWNISGSQTMKINRRQFLAGLGALSTLSGRRLFAQSINSYSLLRTPCLQRTQQDGVTIVWATLGPGTGYIQYSEDGYGANFAEARSRIFLPQHTGLPYSYVQHEATIRDLAPNTPYQYSVLADGESISSPGSCCFSTAGTGPFSFVVFGDSGQGGAEQYALASRIAMEGSSFVLHTGDLAYMHGTFEQYHSNYFPYYGALMNSVPFFPTPGNHDYLSNNAAAYLALHSVPQDTVPFNDRGRYYSFDWGNAHFVSLDSNASLVSAIEGTGSMLEWLEADLRATRQFWRIVFFHHPPYAAGPNQSDEISSLVRESMVPILEKYGVQLVLNGHEHAYHRSRLIRNGTVAKPADGITYVTSGGGGAFLYPVFPHNLVEVSKPEHHYIRVDVRGTRMTLRTVGIDGTEIDRVTLAPPPAIAADGAEPAVRFSPRLEPGAMVRIAGRGLAAEERYASDQQLPRDLAGTVVTLNGRPISLLYVSSQEIRGQVPFDVRGSVTLGVSTPNGFVETSIRVP